MNLQALNFGREFGQKAEAGFVTYLGAHSEFISNERILRAMHEIRSRSKFLSEAIRRESKVWLAEHEPLE